MQYDLYDNHKFEQYHKDNPEIYAAFLKFTWEAIRAGRKNFATNTIIERIRWYTSVEAKGKSFKINNNYAPYYARLFEKEYPKHKGFFRKRRAYADSMISA